MGPEREATTPILRGKTDRIWSITAAKVREGWRKTWGWDEGGGTGGLARCTGLKGQKERAQ